jgi:hypothetical protein
MAETGAQDDVTRMVDEGKTERSIRPLKMWPIGCPETSVTNYQSALRNIPEERKTQ